MRQPNPTTTLDFDVGILGGEVMGEKGRGWYEGQQTLKDRDREFLRDREEPVTCGQDFSLED